MTIVPLNPKDVFHDGRVWQKYAVHYTHEGNTYSFEIFATSFEDAQDRVASIKGTAKLDGLIIEEIEA